MLLEQVSRREYAPKESGHIVEGRLPKDVAPVTVVIPTNYRWTVPDPEYDAISFFNRGSVIPKVKGPLPFLIRDLVEAREREGVDFDLTIVDDTIPQEREDIQLALNYAFQDTKSPPRTNIIGTSQREELYTLLDRKLPPRYSRDVLRILITQGGYGPQRVRADSTVAYQGKTVLSLDDDLRLGKRKQIIPSWLQRNDFPEHDNSFVYVKDDVPLDEGMVESVFAHYLTPFVELLGKSVEEIMEQQPEMIFANGTHNTKDLALEYMLSGNTPTQFVTTHSGLMIPRPDARVGIATGRKMTIPDINAGTLVDYFIAAGITAGGLPITAYPSGSHTSFITSKNSHPDCAVTGRDMTDPHVLAIPWLVSNPEISRHYGRVRGPYRAEDRLYTLSLSETLLTAHVPAIFSHERSRYGFRTDHITTAWSEDLGDAWGDLIFERIIVGDREDRLIYKGDGEKYVLRDKVALTMYDKAHQRVHAIQDKMHEISFGDGVFASMDHQHQRDAYESLAYARDKLLAKGCGMGYDRFYQSINNELREQLQFFKETLDIYYPLMEACAELRQNGEYPALQWIQ